MKAPDNSRYVLFGGTFLLANKLQFVGDKMVEGISTKQWFLLRNISEIPKDPPPTITEIANAMDSTRQNVAKMLTALEREGFVAINKSQSDHRSRDVAMTDRGSEQLSKMAENARMFFDKLFNEIPPDDLDTAAGVLKKMVSNLERMQEDIL